MGVSTFTQPNHTAQTETVLKTAYDDAANVFKRVAQAFAVHEQTSGSPAPDMTVRVDAGYIPKVGAAATEVAAQSTAVLAAPTGNPRRDIVHVDATTGSVGVATGVEAASPVDPAIPAGKVALARLALSVGMTTITNAAITDLRELGLVGVGTYVQNGNAVYAAASSGSPTGTDYTAAVSPALAAYAAGQAFLIKFDEQCQARPTLALNGLAALGLFKSDGTALAAGDIKATALHLVAYNASFGLGSPQEGGFEVLTAAAAAATALAEIALQVFTATGTYTKPADLVAAWVFTVGGGGGGGGCGTSVDVSGGGGGGGGTAIKLLLAADIGATETVTVGAGGAAGAANSTGTGGTGGTSSFGALDSATGGVGGSGSSALSAGAGGAGSGGNLNVNGGGGTGGGTAQIAIGAGGASVFGGGGKSTYDAAGAAGGAYGGGGAGAQSGAGTARTGGAGAAGVVFVLEFKS